MDGTIVGAFSISVGARLGSEPAVGEPVGNEVGELDGKGVGSVAVGISSFQQIQAKKIITRRRGCLFIVSFSSALVYWLMTRHQLF